MAVTDESKRVICATTLNLSSWCDFFKDRVAGSTTSYDYTTAYTISHFSFPAFSVDLLVAAILKRRPHYAGRTRSVNAFRPRLLRA